MLIVGKNPHRPEGPARPSPGAEHLDLTSARGGQAIAASLAFLSTLPRSDSRTSYEAKAVFVDDIGQTHVRLDRTLDGLRLFGEQVIVHLDRSGAVMDATGADPLGDVGRAAPVLSQHQAIRIATSDFLDRSRDVAAHSPPSAELVYSAADGGRWRKAYSIALENWQLAEGPLEMRYLVDAHSGEVLTAYNEVHGYFSGPQGEKLRSAIAANPVDAFADVGAPLVSGSGRSLYSGVVPLAAHENADGSFALQDDTRGGSRTKDNLERWMVAEAIDFRDDNNLWGEATDSPRQRAGIDAHYAMAMTWDFLKNVLGRNSIDGKGMPLNSYVHFAEGIRETDDPNDSAPINNAYWNGSEMIYGDGDGIVYSPLVSLDIAGHEIAHGLNHETANLQPYRESGGLGEAMSDIFGIGVRWYASKQNPAVTFSWRHGEQAYTPNIPDDARRYMDDPTRDGYSIDHYSKAAPLTRNPKDNGGVHATSGIANNAFFLMAEGGTNRTSGLGVERGIGMERALKIMYRALTTYFEPNTGFRAAATGVVQAAIDLHGEGSPEVQAVRQAWTAAGTLDPTTV